MAAAAALLASREGKGRHDIPNFVLLALWGSVAAPHNATTATSKTSTGLPIAVTFSAARPPALSHLSIDCPGLELDHANLSLAPKVLSTDADLVLLRVPINRLARYDARFSNYFVYRLHSQQAKLDRLPNPDLNFYVDKEIAILRCGDNRYALAVLDPLFEVAFRLHRYLSRLDGKAGSWTSQEVFVKKPLRDTVCPVPDSARRTTYHVTTKVITLGGAGGTVGWVDLWRGILFCDVLKEKPKLHDMPLPLPANGNRSMFLNGCPFYCHDIIVNQSKDTIKYVEMEITQPIMGTSTSDRHSYFEWLCDLRCPQSYCLVPGCWKATIWSMPIPVTSWDDWQYQCSVHSKEIDIPADIIMHYKLLHKFHRDNAGKAMEGTLSLGSLHMAYPTLSIADDDVVYLLSEGTSNSMGAMKMVFAVDVRAGTLQTMVKHDAKRHIGFMRCHVASGISNHLKTSGLQKEGDQEVQEEGAAILQAVGLPLYTHGRQPPLHW